ncbi:MAG: hypothetical protein ACFN0X_04535 [Mitsuokella sp.]
MRKRLGMVLCVLFVLLLPAAASAAERTPLRVARVPLQIGTYHAPSESVVRGMEEKVSRALHLPLNETMHYADFLPKDAVALALAESQSRDPKEIVREIARRMDAGLVVLPLLTGYESYTRSSWDFMRGRILHSYAAVRVVVYDRRGDRVIDKGASDTYDDEATPRGEVGNMAIECMDTALRRTGLHALLWARKGQGHSAIQEKDR